MKTLSVGEKIARIRILEDKTQLEMGDLLNVCQSAYSTWEKRSVIPPVEAMKKIIELGKKYNIEFTVEDILRDMPQRKPNSASKRRGPRKIK